MYFEQKLFQIALWTILFALILGGEVWHFPGNGKFLLQEWFQKKSENILPKSRILNIYQ